MAKLHRLLKGFRKYKKIQKKLALVGDIQTFKYYNKQMMKLFYSVDHLDLENDTFAESWIEEMNKCEMRIDYTLSRKNYAPLNILDSKDRDEIKRRKTVYPELSLHNLVALSDFKQ